LLSELPQRLRRITTSGSYRPEIDGLRFWAILPVVLWHGIQRVSRSLPELSPHQETMVLWVPEAWIGVTMFLTISGFIISSQFVRARQAGRPMSLRSYFYRRVTRIEPPYLLLLLASYLLLSATSYRPENAVAFWRGGETLTESFLASVAYLHGIIFNQMPRLFPGGWSLEVEVQFYIVAPAIFAFFYTARTVRSRMVVGIIVLIMTFAISRYCDLTFGYEGPHRYTLIKYFFYFWLGTLISQVSSAGIWPRLPPAAWDVAAFVSLLAYLLTGTAQHFAWWPSPWGPLDVVRIIAFFLMFGGALNGRSFSRICAVPWISLIGGACYSIYLTHVQVMQVLIPVISRMFQPTSLAAASALALIFVLPLILLASLSFYALVERPFMIPHWPEKFGSWIRAKFGRAAPQEP
jgi:peptidoglycan/LPS O-acetylase OafA/YrhL